jgi:hypothetical protein
MEGDHGPVGRRQVAKEALSKIPTEVSLPGANSPAIDAARKAIMDCIRESCGSSLAESLDVQAKHSAGFMSSDFCRKGVIGAACAKIMDV